MEQGNNFGRDYFEELLERIHEIHASERRFYQKITEIYASAPTPFYAHMDANSLGGTVFTGRVAHGNYILSRAGGPVR